MFVINAKVFDYSDCTLGEGALWDKTQNSLIWLDICKHEMYRRNIQTKNKKMIKLPSLTGCVCLTKTGGYLITGNDGVTFFDEHGERATINVPDFDPKVVRMNDGKVDPFGNLVFGSMDLNERRAIGKLYRLTPDRKVSILLENVVICNGPAFSNDGTWMYFSDSINGQIIKFPYSADGVDKENGKIFYKCKSRTEAPDGLTVDKHGNVWVAIWGGGCVLCLGHEGMTLGKIHIPTQNVTSCTFGGDFLDHVFVTTAKKDCAKSELRRGSAGSVFWAFVGTEGVLPARFESVW